MSKGTIICFGDSNTYGHDPRSFSGGRYAGDYRWPEILDARTDWEVQNCGQNGRCTPYFQTEIQFVFHCLERWSREDSPVWLWIMLGTNDLLHNSQLTAEAVAGRMERFLKKLERREEVKNEIIRLRLISPVHLRKGEWVESEERCRESEKLDACYRAVAERIRIAFSCAGEWDIPLTYDGVHFSEEGNLKFAERIMREVDF